MNRKWIKKLIVYRICTSDRTGSRVPKSGWEARIFGIWHNKSKLPSSRSTRWWVSLSCRMWNLGCGACVALWDAKFRPPEFQSSIPSSEFRVPGPGTRDPCWCGSGSGLQFLTSGGKERLGWSLVATMLGDVMPLSDSWKISTLLILRVCGTRHNSVNTFHVKWPTKVEILWKRAAGALLHCLVCFFAESGTWFSHKYNSWRRYSPPWLMQWDWIMARCQI